MSTIRVNRFENTSSVGYNSIVQSVFTSTSSYISGSTALPIDNSIPQNTEGAEISALNTTITPKVIGNKLRITVSLNWGAAATVTYGFALFKDSNANAVAAVSSALTGGSYTNTISFIYEETISSISATTFKIRAGATAGNTVYINGSNSAQIFSTAAISSMLIEEIQV